MVVMEDLAERARDLARTALEPLWEKMAGVDEAVQGDIIYLIGVIGDSGSIPRLETLVQGGLSPDREDAVRDAIEALAPEQTHLSRPSPIQRTRFAIMRLCGRYFSCQSAAELNRVQPFPVLAGADSSEGHGHGAIEIAPAGMVPTKIGYTQIKKSKEISGDRRDIDLRAIREMAEHAHTGLERTEQFRLRCIEYLPRGNGFQCNQQGVRDRQEH